MRFWCDLALDWFWFWHDVAFGLVLVGVVRVSRLMGAALALRLVCLSFWFGFGLVWFGCGLVWFGFDWFHLVRFVLLCLVRFGSVRFVVGVCLIDFESLLV